MMPILIRVRLSILMPIPGSGNKKIFTTFCSLQCQFTFIFLISIIGVIILGILNSILKFCGKKLSLPLHLVEMDTDPDPSPDPDRQALDADPGPDPNHANILYVDPIGSGSTTQAILL
jgi:hypothetical protein